MAVWNPSQWYWSLGIFIAAMVIIAVVMVSGADRYIWRFLSGKYNELLAERVKRDISNPSSKTFNGKIG